MDCRDIRKMLSEQIEGNSPPSQMALIEEHVRSCEQCRLYAAEIKKTIETLKSLDEIEPPAWLTTKVMKKIRTGDKTWDTWIEWLFFPLHIKLPREAFAALLITVAAIFIYKSMEPELQHMEVQPLAPVMKSIPAEPDKEALKHATSEPKHLREETKHKDSLAVMQKEERPDERPDAVPHSLRSTVRKGGTHTSLTLAVRELDDAKREIETSITKMGGEVRTIEQSESRIMFTVTLEHTKIDRFIARLQSLGTLNEARQASYLPSNFFNLIIEKQ